MSETKKTTKAFSTHNPESPIVLTPVEYQSLLKDRERMEWLCKNAPIFDECKNTGKKLICFGENRTRMFSGKTYLEAIDAAMEAEK